ncbi:hypothetical protein ADEAN_000330900 [Angomonas deanei]|uniref:Uncharacterized protein n=1 Tax=Angomonas deanei TaxID=59799 RepID=A0A7G2C9X2_9TRYP|nr:hypothetical protein ADEAN_000330900 [Angomonas deanei]
MSVAGVVTREIDFNASERILHSLEKVVGHFEKRDLLDPHAIVSFFRLSAAVRFGCPALPSTVHRLTRRAFRSVVGVTPSEELTNVAIQGMRCIARGVAVAHHERAHQMILHFAFVAASGAVDVSNVLLWDAFFEGLFYRCTNPNSLFQRPPWSEAQFWQSVWQPWPSPRPQLALLLCKGLLASNRMEEARALLPMVELETVMTSLFGVERSPTHYDIGELHLLLFYASCDHTGSSAASAQRIVKELHERSGSHLKEQYGTLWRSWESDASNVKKLTVERVRGPPQEVCVRPYDGRPCVMLRSDTTEEEIQFFFSSTGDGTYPYRCYSKVGGWYDHYHPTEEKKSDPQISTKYVLTISSITKQ